MSRTGKTVTNVLRMHLQALAHEITIAFCQNHIILLRNVHRRDNGHGIKGAIQILSDKPTNRLRKVLLDYQAFRQTHRIL